MALKDRLKKLRAAASLTQQELAVKSGLSVSVVAQIERGAIPDPRVSTVQALARGLGVLTEELAPAAGWPESESEPPAARPPRAKKNGKKKR
jgi:transcriptional regulator with XRE-family HTH domain